VLRKELERLSVSEKIIRIRARLVNESGLLSAFDYSNPVVRNIEFTRLSDSTSRP
jgi:hypothetical protein